MDLNKNLINDFVKEMNTPAKQTNDNTQLTGTVVGVSEDKVYVQLDGAPDGVITPATSIVTVGENQTGDRVMVSIKNRSATVIGNFTDPSSRKSETDDAARTAKDYIKDDDGKMRVVNPTSESIVIGDKTADNVVIDNDSIAIKNADIELFKVEANRDSVAHKISSIINLVGAKIEASAPLRSDDMAIFAWSGVTKFVGLGDGIDLGYFDNNEETGIKIVPSHSDGLMTQYPPYIDIKARKDDLDQGIVNNGRITVGDYPFEEDGSGEINPPTISVKEDSVNINAEIKKNGLTIGEIIQPKEDLTGNIALSAGTAKVVASITLPKGKYNIQGNARFNSISTAGTRLLSISTNTSMNYNAYSGTYAPSNNYGYVNVSRILDVTADNTTVNLLAYCGYAINVSYRYLKAIRVA